MDSRPSDPLCPWCPKTPLDHPLIFGGSFNPPHVGHVSIARAARDLGGFGALVLVPTADPPHKPDAIDFASAEHRLAMVRMAFAGDNRTCVDRLEIDRSGKSYTLDTVLQFLRRGYQKPNWLIGADWIIGLSTWHRWQELRQLVTFVVVARPGYKLDFATVPDGADVRVVEVPPVDVSGTEIRRRLKAGESVAGMLYPRVEAYLRNHDLYGASSTPASVKPDLHGKTARPSVDPAPQEPA